MANDDKISKEEVLLSAYFDEEMSTGEREQFAERLSSDSDLRGELEEHEQIRGELRSLFKDARYDEQGKERKIDLWSRIEADISVVDESIPAASPSLLLRLQSILGFSGEGPSVSSLFGLPQLSAGVAAALILFLYFGQKDDLAIVSPILKEEQSVIAQNELRMRQLEQLRMVKEQTQQPTMPSFVAAAPNLPAAKRMLSNNLSPATPPVRMASDSALRGNRELLLSPRNHHSSRAQKPARFERSVELLLGDEQWIGSESIPGGLRAGGIDIDWIKTDRPFKILTPEGQDSPVIWIGRSRYDGR